MKKVLIISPYFPPSNAADMQRIRMSLPYFEELGWEPQVVTVKPEHSDMVKDELLLKSVPKDVKIHYVGAFSKKVTAKLGLGSIALRSLWFYFTYVNQLLKTERFDLVYFSTTQFPVCILGRYWKKRHAIPYVIDLQDPWHSDYYKDKPKEQRPKKYWFSYRLNKYLEPLALKKAAGLISVSEAYIQTVQERYPELKERPSKVILFAAAEHDFELAEKYKNMLPAAIHKKKDALNLVYVGRGGYDMHNALHLLFDGVRAYLDQPNKKAGRLHLYFIGTSYAPAADALPTVGPLAREYGLEQVVTEQTSRVGYYQAIRILQEADGLILIGSDDGNYTASKLYPYILAKRPLLAILHRDSSAAQIILNCNAGELITLGDNIEKSGEHIGAFIDRLTDPQYPLKTDWKEFEKYSARKMSEQQTALFNEVTDARH